MAIECDAGPRRPVPTAAVLGLRSRRLQSADASRSDATPGPERRSKSNDQMCEKAFVTLFLPDASRPNGHVLAPASVASAGGHVARRPPLARINPGRSDMRHPCA